MWDLYKLTQVIKLYMLKMPKCLQANIEQELPCGADIFKHGNFVATSAPSEANWPMTSNPYTCLPSSWMKLTSLSPRDPHDNLPGFKSWNCPSSKSGVRHEIPGLKRSDSTSGPVKPPSDQVQVIAHAQPAT